MENRLRIYSGPDLGQAETVLSAEKSNTTTIRAGEMFDALTDAIQYGRAWLGDFADDEVTLSNDLYEVIKAYQHFRRPSA